MHPWDYPDAIDAVLDDADEMGRFGAICKADDNEPATFIEAFDRMDAAGVPIISILHAKSLRLHAPLFRAVQS